MVLVGGPAMVEAVQTATSTFGIWAIVVVAVVCLAIWLVGISVADNMQARESRRWWRRVHASRPVPASAGLSEIPYFRVSHAETFGDTVATALAIKGLTMVEVDMTAVGDFPAYYPFNQKLTG